MSKTSFPGPLLTSLAVHGAVFMTLVVGLPRLRATDAPPPEDRESFLQGKTFEVPAEIEELSPEEPVMELPADDPAAEGDQVGAASPGAQAPSKGDGAERAVPQGARARRRSTRKAAAGGAASSTPAPPALFGAVGERAATDLSTAFTHAFPIASSADPAWAHAPFGSLGTATVVLELDGRGTLLASRIEGGPRSELAAGIQRTLALIRGRAFTARGATTRLRVSGRVSEDQAHDGFHGDVFALGRSFTAREGSAFFALSIGRRVDVRVTELP